MYVILLYNIYACNYIQIQISLFPLYLLDTNTVIENDIDDNDEEEGEQLLEYVELSEYEKRREEGIEVIKRKEEIFGDMYRSSPRNGQPASITKKKKMHASKVCNNDVLSYTYTC